MNSAKVLACTKPCVTPMGLKSQVHVLALRYQVSQKNFQLFNLKEKNVFRDNFIFIYNLLLYLWWIPIEFCYLLILEKEEVVLMLFCCSPSWWRCNSSFDKKGSLGQRAVGTVYLRKGLLPLFRVLVESFHSVVHWFVAKLDVFTCCSK